MRNIHYTWLDTDDTVWLDTADTVWKDWIYIIWFEIITSMNVPSVDVDSEMPGIYYSMRMALFDVLMKAPVVKQSMKKSILSKEMNR